MHKSIILILFKIFLTFQIFSQTLTLDSLQIQRVAKTCQLWGHLNFFHPFLEDGDHGWQQAFIDHIPNVIHAESPDEYILAVSGMLEYLHDPATYVSFEIQESTYSDIVKYPLIENDRPDSILLFKLHDYSDLEDYTQIFSTMQQLFSQANSYKGIIMDLRNDDENYTCKLALDYYFKYFKQFFSDTSYAIPPFVARYHDGFTPEANGSPAYSSGVYEKGKDIVSPNASAISIPVVVIVNEKSEIPTVLLGLQQSGKATIFSENELQFEQVYPSEIFEMGENIEAHLRAYRFPDDFTFKPDYIFSKDIDDKILYKLAEQYIIKKELPQLKKNSNYKKSPLIPLQSTESALSNNYPDLGERLLAVAKIYTIINYFFAYQDLMTHDWEEVLYEFIPKVVGARDSIEYHLAISEMYSNLEDGHGFIVSNVLRDYWGSATPPIQMKFIEDKAVITYINRDSLSTEIDLKVGDIILEIDGKNVNQVRDNYIKYRSGSNEAFLHMISAAQILNGPPNSYLNIKVQNQEDHIKNYEIKRFNHIYRNIATLRTERIDKPIMYFINDSIGYADLDRLTVPMVDSMFESFKNTKAIIFDMRGYPNGTAWEITPHLSKKKDVIGAKFRRYSPNYYKGMGIEQMQKITLFDQFLSDPKEPYYQGITVMLIDSRAMSQSEHSGLAFKAANNMTFIGSQTSGANGDITTFRVPGNLLLYFSGHDVTAPDGSQLQKIGLVPDIEVYPTIAGIRNGKDEILEQALKYIENQLKMK